MVKCAYIILKNMKNAYKDHFNLTRSPVRSFRPIKFKLKIRFDQIFTFLHAYLSMI
jgi:hypothetical protein